MRRVAESRGRLRGGGGVLCLLALIACSAPTPPIAADPCLTGRFVTRVDVTWPLDLDLLFVVDNSSSMEEEQASLFAALPTFVRMLVTGDRLGDGPTPDDFDPVASLHVGFVTTDMGVADFPVSTCTRAAAFGDDGILLPFGSPDSPSCFAPYPRFLAYEPRVSPQTPSQVVAKLACLTGMDTVGCGWEQPLEAMLKALTPSTSALRFSGGTRGHGDIENAGFLRSNSFVVVVLVTDEEDGSIAAGFEGVFDESATSAYAGDLNLRCFNYPETQYPVQRYIDGLRALRPGAEQSVIFGAITGVPVDLLPRVGLPDYEGILADPRMIQTVDAAGTGLEPSCNVPGRGIAFPPRRIVQVAQGLGESGVVQSICQESYAAALDAMLTPIVEWSVFICLRRTLPRDAAGFVSCNLFEVIPPPDTFPGAPASCAELAGAEPTPLRVNVDGSIDCAVPQLAVRGAVTPSGTGWYYDDFSAKNERLCGVSGQHIEFTGSAVWSDGVAVVLDCQYSCASDADCPGGFTCESVSGGHFCIEPHCLEFAL